MYMYMYIMKPRYKSKCRGIWFNFTNTHGPNGHKCIINCLIICLVSIKDEVTKK